jgi:hypothetical protein
MRGRVTRAFWAAAAGVTTLAFTAGAANAATAAAAARTSPLTGRPSGGRPIYSVHHPERSAGHLRRPVDLNPVEVTSNGSVSRQRISVPSYLWTGENSLDGLPGDAFGVWPYR